MKKLLFQESNYYVYIATDKGKLNFEVGVAGSLKVLLRQWQNKSIYPEELCINLLHVERFPTVEQAIQREKELKRFSKSRLFKLVQQHNPEWEFRNE